jgi:hypothetical protein
MLTWQPNGTITPPDPASLALLPGAINLHMRAHLSQSAIPASPASLRRGAGVFFLTAGLAVLSVAAWIVYA